MDNEQLVKNWHEAIIKKCQKQLGRTLTKKEAAFITSHGGFIALEMIEDTVKALVAADLEKFLKSKKVDR